MKIAILVALGIASGILVIAWFVSRRRAAQRALFERAVAGFAWQSGRSELFLAAANATGKPRGLRWIKCDLHGDPLFAASPTTGEIYALSGATIGFEAIPGGEMEEVEAVGDIRYATLIFTYRDGRWQTDGRAIFNLEPQQALQRFGGTLIERRLQGV